MVDLLSIFQAISVLELRDASQFGAIPLPEHPHFHLAKDGQGFPSILISIQEGGRRSITPSITLEHVTVYFDVFCRITRNDRSAIEGKFTVIRCTGRERLLHAYFLRVARILVDLLPELPTKVELTKAISTLVELFRASTSPPRKSVQGLWAELLIIEASRKPETLVAAWHSTPLDRYDFNAADERLEVKCTAQRVRQHYFSLDQLVPLKDAKVIIASLFTEAVANGTTVIQLADSVRDKISTFPDLVEHFDRIVVMTLGENWRTAFEDIFDKQLALSTLRFYDAQTIPTIALPLPTGVSEVRFKSDLSLCEPVDMEKLQREGNLFSAIH